MQNEQRKRKWKLSKYLLANKILHFIVLDFRCFCFCASIPYQDFAVCNKKKNMV